VVGTMRERIAINNQQRSTRVIAHLGKMVNCGRKGD
jgi:hypothetical protein